MTFKPVVAALVLACAMFTGCHSGTPGDADADVTAMFDAALDAGDGCRDSSACSGNTSCVGPNDVVCGVPPREECQIDADCVVPGDVCHAIADSCSPDGVGSSCGAPCAQPDPCGPDFACDAQGACRPIACDAADYDCRPSETCDPTSVDPTAPVPDISHGCVTIACTDDTPCPGSTTCVNGYCQDGPGICLPPVP